MLRRQVDGDLGEKKLDVSLTHANTRVHTERTFVKEKDDAWAYVVGVSCMRGICTIKRCHSGEKVKYEEDSLIKGKEKERKRQKISILQNMPSTFPTDSMFSSCTRTIVEIALYMIIYTTHGYRLVFIGSPSSPIPSHHESRNSLPNSHHQKSTNSLFFFFFLFSFPSLDLFCAQGEYALPTPSLRRELR